MVKRLNYVRGLDYIFTYIHTQNKYNKVVFSLFLLIIHLFGGGFEKFNFWNKNSDIIPFDSFNSHDAAERVEDFIQEKCKLYVDK
jgi:hypothetical protein